LDDSDPANCVKTEAASGMQGSRQTAPFNHKEVKRIGMVIKIRPEKIDEYKALHAGTNPGVRDLLEKYHMRNFSIFLTRLDDGNYYEFGYYEYWGNDFEKDKALLDAEPRNKEWLKICDPLQVPLQGEKSWREMESVYKNY
jgi:L-rhamnose mutarotase